MKNKKVTLSVLSAVVVSSMATSAFAADFKPGMYLGGDIDKYYSIDTFIAADDDMRQEILDEMVDAGLENTLYVDTDGVAGTTIENLVEVQDLEKALEELTGDEFETDGYQEIDENGEEGEVIYPVPVDGPVVDDATAEVDGDDVVISGTVKEATDVRITVGDKDYTASEGQVEFDEEEGTFSLELQDLKEGEYEFSVVAINEDKESRAFEDTFTVEASEELKVESVSAINLKQVDINFNVALDKKEAEKTSNFKLDTNTLGTSDKAVLLEDGKTVRLTLNSAQTNNSKHDITVSKNLKNADGVALTADYTAKEVVFKDTSIPTFDSVVQSGPNKIKLQFSEPVDYTGTTPYSDFIIDNGSIAVLGSADDTTYVQDGVIELTLGTNLPNGEHTVKVKGGVEDFAAYKVLSNSEQKFTFTGDVSAPTATLLEANETTVKVKFSKPLSTLTSNNNILFRHTYNSNTYQVDATKVTMSEGNTVATIDFTQFPIAPGANNLFIVYKDGTQDTGKVKDSYGNILQPATLGLNITGDTVAPTVQGIKAVDSTTLEVTYSEEVIGAATASNYTVLDAAGVAVAVNSATLKPDTTKTYVIKTATLKGGNYTFTVDGITDKSVAKNKLVKYTTQLSITDLLPPTIGSAVAAVDATRNNKYNLLVSFSEPMNAQDLANLSNYRLYKGGQEVELKSTNAVLSVIDPQSVKIATEFTDVNTSADKLIVNGSMKDSAGNAMGGFSVTKDLSGSTVALKDLDTVAGGNQFAKVTAKDTFEITVDKLIDVVNVNNIEIDLVNINGIAPANAATNAHPSVVSLVKDTAKGTTKVVFRLPVGYTFGTDVAGLKVDANAIDFKAATFTTSLGDSNASLLPVANTEVVDLIAPEMLKAVAHDTSTADGKIDSIDVTFSEDLLDGSIAFDKFQVEGYKVTAASETSGVVTLTVVEDTASGTGATPVVKLVGNLNDNSAARNVIVANADTKVTATEDAAPMIASVAVKTVGTASDDNDQLVITFTEAMDKTKGLTKAAAEQFAVKVAGSAVTFGTAAAGTWSEDGKTLTINMNEDVVTNDTFAVTYTGSTTLKLQDLAVTPVVMADVSTPITGVVTGAADTKAPVGLSATPDASGTTKNKKVTISFNESILNNTADLTALKAAITFAADGSSYGALATNDTVAIVDGKLVVTFDSAITGSTNAIKIAAGALKDSANNPNAVITLTTITAAS